VEDKSLRKDVNLRFDALSSKGHQLFSMAAEIRDRLFGPPPPADTAKPTAERMEPVSLMHIVTEGLTDARDLQIKTEKVLDDILNKL
jgi:hypothetical protein